MLASNAPAICDARSSGAGSSTSLSMMTKAQLFCSLTLGSNALSQPGYDNHHRRNIRGTTYRVHVPRPMNRALLNAHLRTTTLLYTELALVDSAPLVRQSDRQSCRIVAAYSRRAKLMASWFSMQRRSGLTRYDLEYVLMEYRHLTNRLRYSIAPSLPANHRSYCTDTQPRRS